MVGRRDLLKRGGSAIAVVGMGGLTSGHGQSMDGLGAGDPKHVVLIVLDRSGSMSGVQKSVTDGINQYLDEQAGNKNMYIGLVQFDDCKTSEGGYCEPIFSFTPADATPRLGLNDYQPRGSTPLLAAVVEGIGKLEKMIRPIDRALMVFQTDGYENASPQEITKEVVKQLITAKETEGNWTFAFMGADIDAWGEGGSMGYHAGSTLQYQNNVTGTAGAYSSLSNSSNTWYTTTGGGASTVVAARMASNTADAFFIDPSTTTIVEPPKNKKKTTRSTKTPKPSA